VNIQGVGALEDEWQKPTEFMPERWDPTSPYFLKPDQKRRSAFALSAFGYGVRRCPGEFLAKLQIKIFLAFMIFNYRWKFDTSKLVKEEIMSFAQTSN